MYSAKMAMSSGGSFSIVWGCSTSSSGSTELLSMLGLLVLLMLLGNWQR
jgi:hypothetical protein